MPHRMPPKAQAQATGAQASGAQASSSDNSSSSKSSATGATTKSSSGNIPLSTLSDMVRDASRVNDVLKSQDKLGNSIDSLDSCMQQLATTANEHQTSFQEFLESHEQMRDDTKLANTTIVHFLKRFS